jgi:hypothetical protein
MSAKFLEARDYLARRLGIEPSQLAEAQDHALENSDVGGPACLDPLEIERCVTEGLDALDEAKRLHLASCSGCAADLAVASEPSPDDLGLRATELAEVARILNRLNPAPSVISTRDHEPASAIAVRLATVDSLAYAIDLTRHRPSFLRWMAWRLFPGLIAGQRFRENLDSVYRSVFIAMELEAKLVATSRKRENARFETKYRVLAEEMKDRAPEDLQRQIPRLFEIAQGHP